MSESLALIVETAERVFAGLAARRGEAGDLAWAEVEASGLLTLLVPEQSGGFGGDWPDAFAVARLAGYHGLDASVVDAMLQAEGARISDPLLAGALLRAAQIAGALDAALAMSIAHANDRVQFGKPIGKFQAVQQSLAVFAEEAAAANAAGQAAALAMNAGEADFEVGAAKLRANRAADVGAAIAHQVHGAIGFTQESALHQLTRRLAAWRVQFGSDRFWADRLGRQVALVGADGFWPWLASRSEPAYEIRA